MWLNGSQFDNLKTKLTQIQVLFEIFERVDGEFLGFESVKKKKEEAKKRKKAFDFEGFDPKEIIRYE